jgi:hypothetical protein
MIRSIPGAGPPRGGAPRKGLFENPFYLVSSPHGLLVRLRPGSAPSGGSIADSEGLLLTVSVRGLLDCGTHMQPRNWETPPAARRRRRTVRAGFRPLAPSRTVVSSSGLGL